MIITPHQLEAAYEYLRVSNPFNSMNLPDSDLVEFRVVRDRRIYGWHKQEGRHIIAVSSGNVTHTLTLMWVAAHEMIHLFQAEHRPFIKAVHNKEFQDLADIVCSEHGFDRGVFS